MLSILLCLAGIGAFLAVIRNHHFIIASGNEEAPSMDAIGKRLLDIEGYVLPFEVISILLLAAMVGAIAIAKGRRIKKDSDSETESGSPETE